MELLQSTPPPTTEALMRIVNEMVLLFSSAGSEIKEQKAD